MRSAHTSRAGEHMYKKEAFVAAFIAAAPVGHSGWKQRAEARAGAAWKLYCAQAQEEAYAAASARARSTTSSRLLLTIRRTCR